MKKQLYKTVCLFITIFYCFTGQAQWTPVGNINSSPSYFVSLAFNKHIVPFVLYGEDNSYTTVKKYEDSIWNTVGNAGFSNNYAIEPVLAIAHNDTPYIAFSEWANGYPDRISVMKFDGVAWQYVGHRFVTPNASYFVSLATDSSHMPYIAFQDRGDLSKLSVMKFNGISWEYVGMHSFSPRNVSYVSLAFDKLNKPYVALRDSSNKASVMKFDGTNWNVVGAFGFSAGTVHYNTSLAIDNNNLPYVAYTDIANGNKASVMKFDGAQWINAGAAGFSSTAAFDMHIVIDSSNIPYIGYKNFLYDGRATVMRLDNNTWNVVGKEAFTPYRFYNLSLALNKYGTPYIATDSSLAIVMKYVRPPFRFTGSGDWNNAANWSNNIIPPNPLPGDYAIIIDPAQDECILNGTITLLPGARLTVQQGKIFTVNGNLIIL